MKLNNIFKRFGFQIARVRKNPINPFYDLSDEEIAIMQLSNQFSMTGQSKIAQLIQSINYIEDYNIPGDIVECGVWRGGSMLAAAMQLKFKKTFERNLFLFDTFEGMNKPTEKDTNVIGINALEKFERLKINDSSSDYCYASLEDVINTMSLSGYPKDKIIFKKGVVEDTLPCNEIEKIALLRLDTDWYESTKHELIHLYDKLVVGGVLIIDDYGYWKGSRLAVDEFLKEKGIQLFLGRIDAGGRIAIKP